MQWIPVNIELPSKEGKYVVRTKRTFGEGRFDARLHVSEKKKTWDVSNQIVTHWLKEN